MCTGIAYILGVSSLKLMEASRNVSKIEKYVSEGLQEVTEERNGEEQNFRLLSCKILWYKL